MSKYQLPQGSLISFMSNKVKTQGGINLAQGIPAFDPPQELLKLLNQLSFDNLHQYAAGRGNLDLLQQLAKSYALPQSQFLMVNGATEANSLLFTYLQYKHKESFTVLAFDPVYESYKNLARIFNLPFVAFPDTVTLDFESLEVEIVKHQVKLILVASPGNPYGKIWSKEDLDNLFNLAEKHDFYIVFDAVYADLYFDEAPYQPIDKLNDKVFYVNAFSKQFSITGWRLGYVIATPSNIDALADIHDYTGLCAPSILQQALATYLDKYNFGIEYTEEIRDQLKGNYMQLSRALNDLGFELMPAQGGYFVWDRLPEVFSDGFDFAVELYEEQKVATIPGVHFSDQAKNFVRFNIARHPYEISMAVSRIKAFVNSRK